MAHARRCPAVEIGAANGVEEGGELLVGALAKQRGCQPGPGESVCYHYRLSATLGHQGHPGSLWRVHVQNGLHAIDHLVEIVDPDGAALPDQAIQMAGADAMDPVWEEIAR